MSVDALLHSAFAAHQSADLKTAEQGYLRVLQAQPAHPDALNLLGVAYSQQQAYPQAIDHLLRAIAARPEFVDAWLNLAKTFSSCRRWREAAGACDMVLRLSPKHVEALATQARVLRKLKQFAPALASARAALALQPKLHEMARLEAGCLAELRQYDQARACFEQCLARQPDDPALINDYAMLLVKLDRDGEAVALLQPLTDGPDPFLPACSNLGNLLDGRGDAVQARVLHERVVNRNPRLYAGWINYANVLQRQDELALAREALERAMELEPGRGEAYVNLAGVLMAQHDEAGAQTTIRKAIALAPDFADAWNNLGAMELDAARPRDAQEAYLRAVQLDPEMAAAQFGAALSHLMQGNFAQGWPLYEWRWLGASQSKPKERPRFACPQWQGQPTRAESDRIIVYHEQGFGDTVQFLRFVPALAERFARVTLIVQPSLHELAQHNLPNKIEVLTSEEGSELVRSQPFDWHCPMGSLPLALGVTDVSRIVGYTGYLKVLPNRALPPKLHALRQRSRDRRRLLVGICWAGNPGLAHDRTRSLKLEMLRQWFTSDEISADWVSLQHERTPQDAEALAAWGVLDLGPQCADFADTAKVISQLDLVISVDTVIVHLAGALGRPTWLLNRFQSEWRWMLETEKSVWYGTVRQFRQIQKNDWADVVVRVHHALLQASHSSVDALTGSVQPKSLFR